MSDAGHTVRNGAIVCLFIVPVDGERVGNTGEFRFNESVLHRIVETLSFVPWSVVVVSVSRVRNTYRTRQDLFGLGGPCSHQCGVILCRGNRHKTKGQGEYGEDHCCIPMLGERLEVSKAQTPKLLTLIWVKMWRRSAKPTVSGPSPVHQPCGKNRDSVSPQLYAHQPGMSRW